MISDQIIRIKYLTILLLTAFSASHLSCVQPENSSVIYDLRCENLTDPLGVDTNIPRFSWKIRSDKNGTLQTAFQILVAGDSTLLKEETADLWDSGKVSSPASNLIQYNGKPLKSGSPGYWKVRMWDGNGSVSQWSSIAGFSVGLINAEDWEAEYIGLNDKSWKKDLSGSPLLRGKFILRETGQRLLLHVNSLGYHEAFINGIKVGNDVLSPAVSQFDKRSLVNTYDVSSLVKTGENDLVIWLGRGWYSMGLPGVVYKGPLVKAQLEMVNSGNREIILATGEGWKGRMSGYSLTGSWQPHKFGGEIIDGIRLVSDLSPEGLDKLEWIPVSLVPVPQHQITPQMAEPNRIQEILKADTIFGISRNTWLVDMGKNFTGWIKISFPVLKRGQKITMEYCDHLDSGGKFVDRDQRDTYIASGEGKESFMNKFNYHGFRYIRISNLEVMPSVDSVTGFLIHTDYQMESAFKCSDEDMNRIHDMIRYTLGCLSLGGYLVDCPQIERLGYGGDGNASTETAQTMFDLAPLYANWLQAWGDCIREDGGMPHTAPNPYKAGGGPYWCGFIISASWKTFLNYGDTLILRKYYPAMQQWLGYVEKYSTSGILKRWPDTGYRNWYLGDWASPDGINIKSNKSVDLVNNSFICMCYDYMQKIAGVLGKADDIQKYTLKRDVLREQVHSLFFDSKKNIYGDGYQIDLSFPLLAGIVPDSLTKKVEESLYNEIRINSNGHIAGGLVGIPVFTEWATENNAANLVYSMLKKRDYPGYLYMLENGATTTWEHWKDPRSYIHNCFNGIGSWFYQAVGGIRMDKNYPAWKQVIIQPQIPDGITWAKTTRETPYGPVVVNWKIEGELLRMKAEIPPGVNSGVVLPDGIKKYTLDGKDFKLKRNETKIQLTSGKFNLTYLMKN